VAGDDSDRRAILARRKLFIASALAGLATASCDKVNPFRPCLSMAPTTTADGGVNTGRPATAQPCLEAMPPEPDDAGAGPEAPAPRPCLKPVPPVDAGMPSQQQPQACLKIAPPPDAPKK
jgi:hypothetical protein